MWWKRSTKTNWQYEVSVQIQSDFDRKNERMTERSTESKHARKRATDNECEGVKQMKKMWRTWANYKVSIDVILLLLFAILFISWISVLSLFALLQCHTNMYHSNFRFDNTISWRVCMFSAAVLVYFQLFDFGMLVRS